MSLKKVNSRCLKRYRACSISFNSSNISKFFCSWILKGLYQSSGKEKESCRLLFTSSTKREIRHFHVVVVQRQQRNVQKRVMHVQSCCFANRCGYTGHLWPFYRGKLAWCVWPDFTTTIHLPFGRQLYNVPRLYSFTWIDTDTKSLRNEFIPILYPNKILVLVWKFILVSRKLTTKFIPNWKSHPV